MQHSSRCISFLFSHNLSYYDSSPWTRYDEFSTRNECSDIKIIGGRSAKYTILIFSCSEPREREREWESPRKLLFSNVTAPAARGYVCVFFLYIFFDYFCRRDWYASVFTFLVVSVNSLTVYVRSWPQTRHSASYRKDRGRKVHTYSYGVARHTE